MKKVFIYILITLCFPQYLLSSDNSKVITVTFNKNDFNINLNKNNALEITSTVHFPTYSSDTSEPGLPMIPVNVYIPQGFSYLDMEVSQHQAIYKEGVLVEKVPLIVPTNSYSEQEASDYSYPLATYPQFSVVYGGTDVIKGHNIACFWLSPFQYDAKSKTLFFTDKFTINVSLKKENGNLRMNKIPTHDDFVRNLVVNPTDLPSNKVMTIEEDNNEQLDYVIITTADLAEAFKPIIEWKNTKGVRAKVITIEYIKEHYINKTIQMQIKDCLFDLYRTKSLKYVLLGGDDTVVPALGCKGEVSKTIDLTIPTDLFYGALGTYNWDNNNNGTYGDVEDNIDMEPWLIVTRVPVRTTDDVHNFDFKILTYEKEPLICGWENKMLMIGAKFSQVGDAVAKGEKMYAQYIQPYWDGNRFKFYDTDTDFTDGVKHALNPSNVQEQLSMGYNFVDFIGHGAPPCWQLSIDSYTSEKAKLLSNKRLITLITTSACHTNAFDDSNIDPCLSEGFMRSARSGVIAYLGSSREGWDYNTYGLGPSPTFNALFYEYLFSSELENKNFGAIVAAVKTEMISRCKFDSAERWLQYAINPIGDPEMPIFTETPKKFDNISLTQKGTDLMIDTGVEGCRICVMDTDWDDSYRYYKVSNNVRNAVYRSLPKHVSICITKQNYIPKVYRLSIVDNVYIQNETISLQKTIDADIVKIGSQVTQQKEEGKVVIGTGPVKIRANTITIDNETIIRENANFTITNKKFE